MRKRVKPLGIDEAIEPGGVCPQADEASPELDEHRAFQDDNQKSYTEQKTVAEQQSRSELDRAWLRCPSTREELEQTLGPVTSKRIGVIGIIRDGRETSSSSMM